MTANPWFVEAFYVRWVTRAAMPILHDSPADPYAAAYEQVVQPRREQAVLHARVAQLRREHIAQRSSPVLQDSPRVGEKPPGEIQYSIEPLKSVLPFGGKNTAVPSYLPKVPYSRSAELKEVQKEDNPQKSSKTGARKQSKETKLVELDSAIHCTPDSMRESDFPDSGKYVATTQRGRNNFRKYKRRVSS